MLEHGIDLHKRSLVIATLDREGTVLKRRKIPARRSALLELKLAHARQLKAIAAAKVKTDAVDALTLAQLLRADLIPEAHMISSELRGYRDLPRTRLRLVQRRTSAKNSISRILEKYNVSSTGQLPPFAFMRVTVFEEQIELLHI